MDKKPLLSKEDKKKWKHLCKESERGPDYFGREQ